jgi:hypothetical protein
MIQLLGDRFASGASVRNEYGMLPMHLVIIACASPIAVSIGSIVEPVDVVRTVLKYFPGAIGVTDNDGNLPIHTAASVLRGPQGACKSHSSVCYLNVPFRCAELFASSPFSHYIFVDN